MAHAIYCGQLWGLKSEIRCPRAGSFSGSKDNVFQASLSPGSQVADFLLCLFPLSSLLMCPSPNFPFLGGHLWC